MRTGTRARAEVNMDPMTVLVVLAIVCLAVWLIKALR
jgi:hypothetical protein